MLHVSTRLYEHILEKRPTSVLNYI